MSFCKQCGAPLEGESRFCSQCGSATNGPNPAAEEKRFCSNCGAPMERGVYCSQCGAAPRRSCVLHQPYVGGWLVWSIITAIVFFPLGLGALAFSLAARFVASSYAEAKSLSCCAFLWNLAMWILPILIVLFGTIWILCHFLFFGVFAALL